MKTTCGAKAVGILNRVPKGSFEDRKGRNGLTDTKRGGLRGRINLGLEVLLLGSLMGCVGYVDGGYGGTVIVPGPDVYFYGGPYERGRDVRVYSHRGAVSRGAAHRVSSGHGGRR